MAQPKRAAGFAPQVWQVSDPWIHSRKRLNRGFWAIRTWVKCMLGVAASCLARSDSDVVPELCPQPDVPLEELVAAGSHAFGLKFVHGPKDGAGAHPFRARASDISAQAMRDDLGMCVKLNF
jgi:hypothetical protein